MPSFFSFMRNNAALIPLFAIAGAGCAAAVSYPLYLLKTHPDIQIDKKNNPYPWQRVEQHENTKFFSSNPSFFEGRRGLKSPNY
ncbi:NADH-ubiquinone reductase complex 1 MLRQ subunit-domain-containing protein [Gilbertella persicaria]|uniref:NADH-ubiquinone reductase complex 1 MLRQ subunit-domain-containing protein n=1 Tax=Gilbertella persicaria TaxID=101096 RepID=UPI002220673F|nr:NADH-ubiquinone reductase complex 1 MLRQ subunit-domain-containing protein [Gilbertella persicaria]KAI8079047.1 NADH-ubiquinone reductase complex 1 MLRQ subunit-domain-containing protein [Gilbertella persicaria]